MTKTKNRGIITPLWQD